MKWLWTAIALAMTALVLGGVFIFTGIYNVAATSPHLAPVKWIMETVTDRSVESHARGITAPNLDDSAMFHEGFEHFQEMCVECHGAPGIERSEMARGLYPKAPRLTRAAKEMSAAELYWVTKNGVKMTGMPAFAPTHTDDQIWAITAFLEKLPAIDSAGYDSLEQKWVDTHLRDEGEGEHRSPGP
jgi:mono/diheme cytochrome c family protein